MIKKAFKILVSLCFLFGCIEEKISIPVPFTYVPERVGELEVKLSMSIVKNFDNDVNTGFLIYSRSQEPNNTVVGLRIPNDSGSGNFFSLVIKENRLLRNSDYYVRSYVEFEGRQIIGNEVKFTTTDGFYQIIESVTPNFGKTGDTFEIHGQYFVPDYTRISLHHNNSDKFFFAQLISVSENKIVAKVPDTEGKYGNMDLLLLTDQYGLFQVTSRSTFKVDP